MGNQQEEFRKLAYAVGFFLGDGHLYVARSRGSFQVRFEKPDLECLEKVSRQLAEVFGNGGTIRVRRREGRAPVGCLIVCSRDVWEWLAGNTLMRRVVPREYFGEELAVQREVLAGLMDSDGSVERNGRYVTVRFTNCELGLVDAVRGLARNLGIGCGSVVQDLRHARVGYRMTLNAEEYWRRGYFVAARKQERLEARFRDESSETSGRAKRLEVRGTSLA